MSSRIRIAMLCFASLNFNTFANSNLCDLDNPECLQMISRLLDLEFSNANTGESIDNEPASVVAAPAVVRPAPVVAAPAAVRPAPIVAAPRVERTATRGVAPWSPQNPECQWPNGAASGAVSFTYDDSLISQLDNAAPAMESMGVRGTFFVMDSRFNSEFAQLEKKGHEVAGHSALCNVSEGVVAGGRQLLQTMNAYQWGDVYAYPCGRVELKRFLPKYGFSGARGVRGVVNHYGFDKYEVNSFSMKYSTKFDTARKHYLKAANEDGWAVYHYHQVDGGLKSLHDKLIKETTQNANLWVAPFGVVLKCAKQAGYTK